jgi:hypothetical protein
LSKVTSPHFPQRREAEGKPVKAVHTPLFFIIINILERLNRVNYVFFE